jgi:hypothetical protein
MKRRSSYKVTFLDRHGPAGMLYVKALWYGASVFALSGAMFYTLSSKLELTGLSALGFTVACASALGAASMFFGLRSGQAAGDAAQYLTAGGSSTPYEDQFSEEQARVMQRDYAGAAALFEHRIALNRDAPDVRVLIAAADLYRTYAENPTRAADLYRQAQKLPALTPGQDVYVANKLADLYLGPLKQPGKALVEFRRLIERYPGSRTADQARMALTNVKQDLMAEQQG